MKDEFEKNRQAAELRRLEKTRDVIKEQRNAWRRSPRSVQAPIAEYEDLHKKSYGRTREFVSTLREEGADTALPKNRTVKIALAAFLAVSALQAVNYSGLVRSTQVKAAEAVAAKDPGRQEDFNKKIADTLKLSYEAIEKIKKAQGEYAWSVQSGAGLEYSKFIYEERLMEPKSELHQAISTLKEMSREIAALGDKGSGFIPVGYNGETLNKEEARQAVMMVAAYIEELEKKADSWDVSMENMKGYMPDMSTYGPNILANIIAAVNTDAHSSYDNFDMRTFADRIERLNRDDVLTQPQVSTGMVYE